MEPLYMKVDRTLEITTNIGCHLRCSYCPQKKLMRAYQKQKEERGKSIQFMTLSKFTKCISTVPHDVDIHFSGFSEPWYALECTEMVELANAKGHCIEVFTTTDGMINEHIDRLKLIPFKRFVIHLPDENNDMHLIPDKIYLDRLQKIIQAIPNAEFITIGVPHPDIVALLGHASSTFRVHTRAGNVQINHTTIGTAFSEEEILQKNANTSLVCRRNRMMSNVLLPDGDIQFCSMDYGLKHTLGNS
jgi:hypothetical protein